MADFEGNALRQSLARLQAELARAPRLDETARQRLRAALADIERRMRERGETPLERVSSDPSGHPLEALAVGFEAEHPTLAASVRQFIELLGQAGL